MKIGIVSPFDPISVADMLDEKTVKSINSNTTSVNTIVRSLLLQGHYLKVFTTFDELTSKPRILYGKNIEIIIVPKVLSLPWINKRHTALLEKLYMPNRLARIMRKEIKDLDVLHAHWTYEYAAAAIQYSSEIPVYVTVRDWCPYQLTLQQSIRAKLYWKLNYRLFKKVMQDKNVKLIANSNYTYDMIRGKIPDRVIPVIPNPIDEAWIIPDKKDKSIQNQFITIAQNINDPRKNITKLLEAFSIYRTRHADASMHLVGDSFEHCPMFNDWRSRNLMDGVKLHGTVKHEELMKLLDKMSCLVHPSIEETFGNILLEAMSRGVACIGGEKSGAIGDVLGHGKYGVVCDITKSEALLEAMESLNNKELYEKLTKEAFGLLKTKYASDVVAKQHIELYMQE